MVVGWNGPTVALVTRRMMSRIGFLVELSSRLVEGRPSVLLWSERRGPLFDIGSVDFSK